MLGTRTRNAVDLLDMLEREERRDRNPVVRAFRWVSFIIFATVYWLVMRAIFAAVCGLAFMHAVGVIHHEWMPQVPTLGYQWSVLIAFLFGVAIGPPIVGNKRN